MITTDNSQTLVNALAKIELLQAQLVSELAAHESWQNEHLRVDGEQCRQIRELEEERDELSRLYKNTLKREYALQQERDKLVSKAECTDDLSRTVFVFENKSDGQVVTAYASQARTYLNDKYIHIATINPRAWIEAHYSEIHSRSTGVNK